tara:strand:+ start:141 stop:428 length:288 start_codon:yes stop_codon:yes gene_type:complete
MPPQDKPVAKWYLPIRGEVVRISCELKKLAIVLDGEILEMSPNVTTAMIRYSQFNRTSLPLATGKSSSLQIKFCEHRLALSCNNTAVVILKYPVA